MPGIPVRRRSGTSGRRSCGLPPRCWACARCRCSTITTSTSIAPIRGRRWTHRDATEKGPSGRRRHLRPRRRVRPSGSHRDLAVHDRGRRRRRRRVVRAGAMAGERAACGIEALLPCVAHVDLGCVPGGGQDVVGDGRRRGAARRPVAGLGDHYRDRHEQRVAHCLARCLVPRVAARGVRAAEGTAAGAPWDTVGQAVLLPRVQHRERRADARNGSVRRSSGDEPTGRARHGATGDGRCHVSHARTPPGRSAGGVARGGCRADR